MGKRVPLGHQESISRGASRRDDGMLVLMKDVGRVASKVGR